MCVQEVHVERTYRSTVERMMVDGRIVERRTVETYSRTVERRTYPGRTVHVICILYVEGTHTRMWKKWKI